MTGGVMTIARFHGIGRTGESFRGEGAWNDSVWGEVRWSERARGDADRRLPSPIVPPIIPAIAHHCDPGPGDAPDLYWQGQADRQREPIALVDAAGLVTRTTATFDAALAARDGAGAALVLMETGAGTGAGIADGPPGAARLRTIAAADQPALDAALARAVRAVAPVAAAVRCPRRDGGAAVVVTLRPIPAAPAARRARGDVTGTGAGAVLTLIDPLARPSAATALWREAFDLTPSEAAVAALLVAGHSLESAAATRGSRATTLRVHLRHLFAKTGTARQSDLVALLLRMG